MTAIRDMIRQVPANRLVVRITPEGIEIREKGRRTWFGPISWPQLHLEIVRRTVDARRRAKEKAKKEAKAARGPVGRRR